MKLTKYDYLMLMNSPERDKFFENILTKASRGYHDFSYTLTNLIGFYFMMKIKLPLEKINFTNIHTVVRAINSDYMESHYDEVRVAVEYFYDFLFKNFYLSDPENRSFIEFLPKEYFMTHEIPDEVLSTMLNGMYYLVCKFVYANKFPRYLSRFLDKNWSLENEEQKQILYQIAQKYESLNIDISHSHKVPSILSKAYRKWTFNDNPNILNQ